MSEETDVKKITTLRERIIFNYWYFFVMNFRFAKNV